MKGEYRDGKIRHTTRSLSRRPPYITSVTMEYDVMPDLGLADGKVYEFELFNGRAIVTTPGPAPKGRRSLTSRTRP